MKDNLFYNSKEIVCAYAVTKEPTAKDVFAPHAHDNYELLFFCDGDADFIVGEAVYHLRKNDLLLIKPSVCHNLRPLSSRPYERVVFNFRESALIADLVAFVQSADGFYRVETNSPVKRFFDNIRECAPLFEKEDFAYFAKTSLNQILLSLKYALPRVVKEKNAPHSTLDAILLYIDENPTLPLTISSLAEQFDLSPSWIAHSFKKTLGVSTSQYINRKKIIYAQSLIHMGVPPVLAAERCGYVNYTTFYRQYKKYLGVSPAQDVK